MVAPRHAVHVRCLLVLAVGSLLTVAWAADKASRQEQDEALTVLGTEAAAVQRFSIDSQSQETSISAQSGGATAGAAGGAQQRNGLASEAPTVPERDKGPAPGQHGDFADTVPNLTFD